MRPNSLAMIARACALSAVFLAAGCGDSPVVPPPGERQPVMLLEAIDMTREEGLELIDRNDTMLVFAVSGRVPALPPGEVVAGAEAGGYLGRIAAARRIGGRLFVTIRPAFVTEVVLSGAAGITVPLGFGSYESFPGGGAAPLGLVETAPGASVSASGIDLAGVVIHDGPVVGAELSAVITRGRLSYEPALDLAVGIAPRTVSDFRAVLSGPYDIEFDALVETTGPCEAIEGVTIASVDRDVVMRIGSLPIAARITLRYLASITITGGFTGACSFHGSASGDLRFGAVRASGRWVDRIDDRVVFDVPEVTLPEHTKSRISFAVWPEIEVAFYGAPCVVSYRRVAHLYREWDGGAPVLEWQKTGVLHGFFSFASGALDEHEPSFSATQGGASLILEEGPFKTAEYIFLGGWGVEGTGDGQFGYPRGIAVDAGGHICVVDNLLNRVQRFSPDGGYVSSWGAPGSGDGQFNTPEKIAIGEGGAVYITDAGNRRVQRFTPDGLFVSKWGSEGTGEGEFYYPLGVAAGEGMIFVSDNISHRVQRFAMDGVYLSSWGSQGDGDAQFEAPMGCAYSPADGGRIVVSDCRNDRVGIFRLTGELDRWFGSAGSGDGAFNCPSDVAVDAAGTIYVCDLGNDRIQIFSPEGVFITKLGSHGTGEGEFDHPESIAVDEAGNLYIADGRNHRVQTFAPRARR